MKNPIFIQRFLVGVQSVTSSSALLVIVMLLAHSLVQRNSYRVCDYSRNHAAQRERHTHKTHTHRERRGERERKERHRVRRRERRTDRSLSGEGFMSHTCSVSPSLPPQEGHRVPPYPSPHDRDSSCLHAAGLMVMIKADLFSMMKSSLPLDPLP